MNALGLIAVILCAITVAVGALIFLVGAVMKVVAILNGDDYEDDNR